MAINQALTSCSPAKLPEPVKELNRLLEQLNSAINTSEALTSHLNSIKCRLVGSDPTGSDIQDKMALEPESFRAGLEAAVMRLRRNNEFTSLIVDSLDVV